jgi:adenosylcobinamide kinase/adenosylcobinamide-phosphate guanylyltransferase
MAVVDLILILGGARSGKSSYAAKTARSLSPAPVYLATSRVSDDDFAARVARHRAERGPEWTTVEEPRSIARADLAGRVVVVDCVTLWLTNLCADAKWDCDAALEVARGELERVTAVDATWIFVSNELGMAPHAEHALTRKFVDAAGFLNQDIARRASRVVLMVAGLPLTVKEPQR